MKIFFSICLIIPFAIVCLVMFFLSIVFDQNCGGYLKRAADANTIDMAKDQLKVAIAYMEQKQLTSGYTSVFYKTPDEDIGFWYSNIKSSYKELCGLDSITTPLERSNMLMKLRETLLDNGKEITCPDAISRYPANGILGFLFIAFGILGCVGLFYVLIGIEDL